MEHLTLEEVAWVALVISVLQTFGKIDIEEYPIPDKLYVKMLKTHRQLKGEN